jgi:thiamine-phosphate pyrophosphorylase
MTPIDAPFRARFYLTTPPLADEPLPDGFQAALRHADVAAVLLRLAPADERTLINRIKRLAPQIQDAGAALMLDGHTELVARSGADGAHLTGFAALESALPVLKPDRIAGAGGLRTRDDAMRAGETGADYVMFGEPSADRWRPSLDAIVERVEWWAELFALPCVAYAASIAEIGALSATGTEFIGLGEALFKDSRGLAMMLSEAAARLKAPERQA